VEAGWFLGLDAAPPSRAVPMILIGLGIAAAGADWWAVWREDRRAEYVLKPLALVFLITAAASLRTFADAATFAFTVAALVTSLLGDVFLMLRRQRFVAGLSSFLLAHLAYVGAFRTIEPDVPTIAIGAALLVAGSVIYRRLRRGMEANGEGGMAVPVALYFLAIAAMGTSALVTPFRPAWDGGNAALAVVGALLFMASDTLIGWTRFVRDLAWGRVAIIVTYHVAQVCLLLALLG
jgi:uncharacterized membrane protein YhhN